MRRFFCSAASTAGCSDEWLLSPTGVGTIRRALLCPGPGAAALSCNASGTIRFLLLFCRFCGPVECSDSSTVM